MTVRSRRLGRRSSAGRHLLTDADVPLPAPVDAVARPASDRASVGGRGRCGRAVCVAAAHKIAPGFGPPPAGGDAGRCAVARLRLAGIRRSNSLRPAAQTACAKAERPVRRRREFSSSARIDPAILWHKHFVKLPVCASSRSQPFHQADIFVNYSHAFQSGSFADVFKHAVLCRILHYLREKPAAFRVIDTHAGAGLYDLSGPEASRGGEWRDGVGRLMAAQESGDLRQGRDAAEALSRGHRSLQRTRQAEALPRLARADARLVAGAGPAGHPASWSRRRPTCWSAICAATARRQTIEIDGWTGLSANVPPPGSARAGAGRSAVRGRRRFPPAATCWAWPTANGRPGFSRCGIRLRGAAKLTPSLNG